MAYIQYVAFVVHISCHYEYRCMKRDALRISVQKSVRYFETIFKYLHRIIFIISFLHWPFRYFFSTGFIQCVSIKLVYFELNSIFCLSLVLNFPNRTIYNFIQLSRLFTLIHQYLLPMMCRGISTTRNVGLHEYRK